jgi:lipoyl(octanoyl) transferase
MKSWHLLPTLSASMPFQMAFDEFLFRKLESDAGFNHPLIRFFFSSEPWITVGYSHPWNGGSEERGNGRKKTSVTPTHRHSDTKICRRITGGGLVEHGNDLIFSIIARKEDDVSFKSVEASYCKIHSAVKTAFESLKLKPRFYREDENLPKGQDCFLYPIATDLALGKKKIAGGSQKRSSGVLLHQESVQLGKVDAEQFVASLRAGFQKAFNVNLVNSTIDPAWFREADRLAKEKYEEVGSKR